MEIHFFLTSVGFVLGFSNHKTHPEIFNTEYEGFFSKKTQNILSFFFFFYSSVAIDTQREDTSWGKGNCVHVVA